MASGGMGGSGELVAQNSGGETREETLARLNKLQQPNLFETMAMLALGPGGGVGQGERPSPKLAPWPVSPQAQGFTPRYPLEQIRMTNPAIAAAAIPGYGTLLRGYQEGDERIKRK